MSGTFPTKLMEGIRGGFSDTLAQVVEQTRQMKENPLAGMDSMPLIHGAVRTMQTLSFQFVYYSPLRLHLSQQKRCVFLLATKIVPIGVLCE